ncbi:hypothetical protein PgNI_10715 [Pyricularia grisea]|uniref:Uncharacterized protein n=1 Tax=Pyricularia grisea TaxID=148305 RepID=A0A6P8AYJ9_PYRGI|nr:hypothetical protein PgNI_10715 [Pyricularia grisea]TLD07410.1 hypothetical protein PgNI_10715 [Pyricularia grisea]
MAERQRAKPPLESMCSCPRTKNSWLASSNKPDSWPAFVRR